MIHHCCYILKDERLFSIPIDVEMPELQNEGHASGPPFRILLFISFFSLSFFQNGQTSFQRYLQLQYISSHVDTESYSSVQFLSSSFLCFTYQVPSLCLYPKLSYSSSIIMPFHFQILRSIFPYLGNSLHLFVSLQSCHIY